MLELLEVGLCLVIVPVIIVSMIVLWLVVAPVVLLSDLLKE